MRHHYVPQSILRRFATTEAWRCLDKPPDVIERIRLADAQLERRQGRNLPICAFERRTGAVTRTTVGESCSSPGLYALSDYKHPLQRALLRYMVQVFSGSHEAGLTFKDFLAIGERPLHADLPEVAFNGVVDGRFAKLIGPLVSGAAPEIDEDTRAFLIEYLTYARLRTPTYRDANMANFRRAFATVSPLSRANYDRLSAEHGALALPYDEFWRPFNEHLPQVLASIVAKGKMRDLVRRGAKVVVLHSRHVPFVVGDYPARAFRPDRLTTIHRDLTPGFRDEDACAVLAIDPWTALLLTTCRGYSPFSHRDVQPGQVRLLNAASFAMATDEVVFLAPRTDLFPADFSTSRVRRLRHP